MPRKLHPKIREEVRLRARNLCEYCHTDERWQCVEFTIDHIDPGAGDNIDNLALACFHCNRRKSDETEFVDAATGEVTTLFNPRSSQWSDHFEWSDDGILIVPKTQIGRVTLELLDLNRTRILRIREADALVGRHPPVEDR